VITIVSSSIKNEGILLTRYGLLDRPMSLDDESIPRNALLLSNRAETATNEAELQHTI
jgi:hypothetical protein